ncbi:hypothetical protein BD626DRAFT_535741 [Schizophyllum amplum]|uniref:Uncharacterized protein n=1 Tax=Schizophyllum amplum TaxID=97359 RepID=A0A550CKE6_9AGAR|nr:hypothetical protein BD626DRAFT_535741 [Auriculariopsis ampla]
MSNRERWRRRRARATPPSAPIARAAQTGRRRGVHVARGKREGEPGVRGGRPLYGISWKYKGRLQADQLVTAVYTVSRWGGDTPLSMKNISFNINAVVVLSDPIRKVAGTARSQLSAGEEKVNPVNRGGHVGLKRSGDKGDSNGSPSKKARS